MKKKTYFKVKSKEDMKYIELLHCLCIMTKYGFRTVVSLQNWLINFSEKIMSKDEF